MTTALQWSRHDDSDITALQWSRHDDSDNNRSGSCSSSSSSSSSDDEYSITVLLISLLGRSVVKYHQYDDDIAQ
jgi:hypothetical protein